MADEPREKAPKIRPPGEERTTPDSPRTRSTPEQGETTRAAVSTRGVRRYTGNRTDYGGVTRSYGEAATPERWIDEQLRTIFRGRIPSEPAEIVAALNRLFTRKEIEGKTVYEYAAQAAVGAGDFSQGQSAAQIGLATRAKNLLDHSRSRLQVIKPRHSGADQEAVQAIRLVLLKELGELTDELGQPGGPRAERIDTLLDTLMGTEEGRGGLFGLFETEFGLENPDRLNSPDEYDDWVNFQMVRSDWVMLRQSWDQMKELQEGDFGLLSSKLIRELKLAGESIRELEDVLDEVGIEASDREVLLVNADADSELTLSGLLSWIRHLCLNEAPQLIREGGRIGVVALIPTLDKVISLEAALLELGSLDEDAVVDALRALQDRLAKASELAAEIAPAKGAEASRRSAR